MIFAPCTLCLPPIATTHGSSSLEAGSLRTSVRHHGLIWTKLAALLPMRSPASRRLGLAGRAIAPGAGVFLHAVRIEAGSDGVLLDPRLPLANTVGTVWYRTQRKSTVKRNSLYPTQTRILWMAA